jgi:hypothetical protein
MLTVKKILNAVEQMQIKYSIQPTTLKDYYLAACITAASRYRIYNPNITSPHGRYAFTSMTILHPQYNGIDLQKIHNLPKNIKLLYSLQVSLLHFITCNS